MDENIRSLLDEAVADVQPRATDPTRAVMRRGRKARLRTLTAAGAAGAVTVILIATGGILAANRSTPGVAAVGRPLSPQASLPQLSVSVDGRVIRTGGLRMLTPNGWHVITGPALACTGAPDTVLIAVTAEYRGNCAQQPQLSFSYWAPTTVDSTAALSATRPPAAMPMAAQSSAAGSSDGTVNEVVLPGGQPLWLTPTEVVRLRQALRSGSAKLTLAMPWANAQVVVNAPLPQTNFVLSGIRSDPVAPARLTLPSDYSAVKVNVQGKDQIVSTDREAINHVLAVLRGLDRSVNPGELPCAGAPVLSGYWQLAGTDMAVIKFVSSDAGGTSSAPSSVTGMVAINTVKGCGFATSSLGGRVHVPRGTLTQIQQLLGGG